MNQSAINSFRLSLAVALLALGGVAAAYPNGQGGSTVPGSPTLCATSPDPDLAYGEVGTGTFNYVCVEGIGPNDSQTVLNSLDFDTTSVFGFDSNQWVLLTRVNAGGDSAGVGEINNPHNILNVDLVVNNDKDPPTSITEVGGASDSGTWSFNPDLWNTYASMMIVEKDGNLNGVQWAGFLVRPSDTAGFWRLQGRNISHLTLYGIPGDGGNGGNGNNVPTPGTLALLGIGALAMTRRRRDKTAG